MQVVFVRTRSPFLSGARYHMMVVMICRMLDRIPHRDRLPFMGQPQQQLQLQGAHLQ
jgi:hypothetical protein